MCPPYSQVVWGFKYILFLHKTGFFFFFVGLFLVVLEKVMATHSSVVAWRIPWTEEPGGYSPGGHKKLDTTELVVKTLCFHCRGHRSIPGSGS